MLYPLGVINIIYLLTRLINQ